jgi:type VI secretion system protein ImpG
MELLDYYRDNLAYIRNLSVEFAEEFPKIAGRLGIGDFECQDPYIERLLEGVAFLSARVEKKLDDSHKNFLEAVLDSVAPNALYPVPSGAVLEIYPNYLNENVRKGVYLKAGTLLDAAIPSINTPCSFSTLEDIPIVPINVTETEYVTRSLSDFGINEKNGLAGLRIKLDAVENFKSILIEELAFYINLSDADASLLLRQLLHDTINIYIRSGDFFKLLPGVQIDMLLTTGENLLLDKLKGGNYGINLLKNFLAYPAFFKFFCLKNIKNAFLSDTGAVELLLVFNRRESSLSYIKGGALRLNCAPALNLFPKRTDRVTFAPDTYEFHVVADKTAPRDYEVVNINRMEFFNEQNETIFFANNFYNDNPLLKKVEYNFFSQRRRKRLVNSGNERRSSYDGTEMFVSFSAQNKKLEQAYQFTAETICTNRDLSLLIQMETPLSSRNPLLKGASFITHPTRPDYSSIEKEGISGFSQLSHITFNLSSLFWQNGKFPLEALRTLIGSYQIRADEEIKRILEGISALESEAMAFRFIKNGAIFFEMGWKVSFTLDESALAGIGYYTFGKIIAELLESFSAINSLMEFHFFTKQSGCIAVWKMLED